MDIPISPSDITPPWLTAALGPWLGDARVVAVETTDIGAGTGIFGEIARLSVSYDQPREDLPPTVVAKLPCVEPENLAVAQALAIYEREIRFFREIAPGTALRVPRCYAAELGDDGRFVLLLEDMGAEFDVGDQIVGATAAQAEVIIDALAELHAGWWETSELHALDWLPAPDAPAYLGAVPQIYRTGLPVLEAEWADRLPGAAIDTARTLEPRFEELMGRIAGTPATFSHGDTRLDNIFFSRNGSGGVAFIDFQLSMRQRGVCDLAYLIGTSIDAVESRERWESLLRRWHARLADLGVSDYPWDDCVRHYREAALFYICGAMSLIGSFDTGNERGAAMATAYTTRLLNHVVDIDAGAVL